VVLPAQLHIAQPFLSVASDIHPLCSFHFLTPFPGAFSALLGVYLFFASSATKLHFFLGVFFHFIIGADTGFSTAILGQSACKKLRKKLFAASPFLYRS
jgi:hypothetical protein